MDFVNDRQEWIVEKWFLIEKHRRKKAEAPKPDYEGNPEVEAFYRRAARKKIIERAAWYGPQKTDEPFAPFLGRSRKSAARL